MSPKDFLMRRSVAAIYCKVLSAALSFIFMWLIAKILSIKEAGIFFFTYNLMMILVQLSRAGTEHSLLTLVSGQRNRSNILLTTINTAIYVAIICAILGSLIYFSNKINPLNIYSNASAELILGLLLVAAIAFSASQALATYFQAQGEIYSQYWSLNVGIMLIGSTYTATTWLNYEKASALNISTAFLVINIIITVSCFALLLRSTKKLPVTCMEAEKNLSIQEISKKTLPYTTVTLLSISTYWGGQLLAGIWLSEEDLATLSICMRVAILVNFIHMSFDGILAPRIAALYKNKRLSELDSCISTHNFIAKSYALVMLLFFIFFGEWVLGAFGEEYISGYSALIIMSITWLIVSSLGPVNTVLLMTGHVIYSRRVLMASGATTILLSIYLIPSHGLIGAVISTSIGTLLLPVLCSIKVWNQHRLNFLSIGKSYCQLISAISSAKQFTNKKQ